MQTITFSFPVYNTFFMEQIGAMNGPLYQTDPDRYGTVTEQTRVNLEFHSESKGSIFIIFHSFYMT